MAGVVGIFAFAVLILFAIFFHELGHFLTARWAGIKVSKFFIGFGPTLWSTRRGRRETVTGVDGAPVTRPETEYGVKAFPIGGFVKIVGMSPYEEIPPEDELRSFDAVPRWKRAIVLAAGSVTHIITALVILFGIFAIRGYEDPDRPTLEIGAVATEVAGERSPALRAGLEPGDRLVAIDGRRLTSYEQVRPAIQARGGRPITVEVIKEDGTRRQIEIDPAMDTTDGRTAAVIGIFPRGQIERGPIDAAVASGKTVGFLVTTFFQKVPDAFAPDTLGLTGEGPTQDRPFSIIGAGKIAGDLASRGSVVDFLALFIQINIFIAIFNMMPLPPLDGGHLLVLGIEKLRGKPVHPRALVPVMAVVLSLMLLLGVLLIYYDIVEPPQLPSP